MRVAIVDNCRDNFKHGEKDGVVGGQRVSGASGSGYSIESWQSIDLICSGSLCL